MAAQRTDWVEEYVARFAGFPLTFDTILLRPQRREGRIDKEVCDLLFALRREGVSIALKACACGSSRGRRVGLGA